MIVKKRLGRTRSM